MADLKKKEVSRSRMAEFPAGTPLRSGDEFPTEDIICEALENKSFERLNNCLVIASSDEHDMRFINEETLNIYFRDDVWTNRYVRTHIGETLRTVSFLGIRDPELRLEAKIISASLLWIVGRTAKTQSLIRKCANIVAGARIIESMGYRSLFQLRFPLVRNAFIVKMKEEDEHGRKRSERTLRNYFMDLADISLTGHTRLRKYGYFPDISFDSYNSVDDSNQTYCMPFSLMMSVWEGLITELDAEISDFDFDGFSRLCAIINGFYDSPYYTSMLEARKRGTAKSIPDYRAAYYYNIVAGEIRALFATLGPGMQGWFSVHKNKRWRSDFIGVDHIKLNTWHFELTLKVMNVIQAMSGMRHSEVLGVMHGSLIYDGDILGLRSVLHKFAPEGGSHEDWVVCRYVEKPFQHLRRINQIMTGLDGKTLDNVPLSLNIRSWFSEQKLSFMGTQRQTEWAKKFVKRHHLFIRRDHIDEFRLLNPNIRDDERVAMEIREGAFWPLRTHQFRRSLAVHLRRLDLISTNDLIRQFKHLIRGMTEWYMSGALNASHFSRAIPQAFAAEIERVDTELSASRAVSYQHEGLLYGEGGKLLMSQRGGHLHQMTFPTLKKAMSMAKRGGQKLVSLGNGFYCMNGHDCEFKAVVQSASCNPGCENMLAGADSVPVWKRRMAHYDNLLEIAVRNNAPQADRDFLMLERDFYADAVRFFEKDE